MPLNSRGAKPDLHARGEDVGVWCMAVSQALHDVNDDMGASRRIAVAHAARGYAGVHDLAQRARQGTRTIAYR